MDKKQLMAGTLAALTVASATMPAALAAQPDTSVPYAVMSPKSIEDAGIALFTNEGVTAAPQSEATLQEQINAAENGVETRITLKGNISEDVTIPADKNIILNLGSFTLTNKSGHTITNNGTLTIEGSGTVDNISHGKAAVYNARGGVVTLNGGKYTRSKEAGKDKTDSGENSYYNIQNHGEMTINDGVTVEQTGNFSSMIASGFYDGTKETVNPKLIINGGTFSGGMNTIKNDDRGILEIHGGTFTNVSQAVLMNWNEAVITDGIFEANTNAEAVIYNGYLDDAMDCGKLTISGGTFTATGNSPVIQQNGSQGIGTIQINDGTFTTGSGKIIGVGAGQKTDVAIVKGSFETSNTENLNALANYVDPSSTYDPATGKAESRPVEEATASIGAKNYKTLADAISAAQNGDTVVLKQDVTESVTVSAGKEITLDLAGKNIQSSANAVTVKGKLTVKDSTATAEPQVEGDTVLYTSGKITAANLGLYAIEGGEIVLESGSVESTGNIGVFAQGNMTTSGDAVNSKITVKGGYILSQEYAASAQGRGAELNIQGGVLKAKDNAVIGGNGTKKDDKDYGGTTINISGGTMIGGIQTAGYIACGVYHPQEGTLNITGGKFQITNGVGVLIRAGSANITGGEIVTTGTVSGWVGDKKIDEGCHGIVYDSASNYPGAAAADKVAVGGDVKIVTDDGNAPVKMHRAEGSSDNKIGVTGGSFSGPVEKEYLENLNAELNTGKGDAPYSYYTDVDAAKEAAKNLGGGTVTDLNAKPSTTNFTVTLKFADDVTADQTTTVAENGIMVLPTPTRTGYAFLGWTDGSHTYQGGDAYTVTAEATLTATWKKTAFTITLDYANNGETATENRGANEGDTITLPTPTRSGRYAFVHWTDGKNTFAGGSTYTVTADVTLTAVWSYTGSSSSDSSSSRYTVSVPTVANGTVSVTPSSASKGTTVTITVKPNDGYELDKLTVTDQNGNRISLSDKGNGEYTFTMPSGKVSVDAAFAKIETVINFRDVAQSDYFYEAVKWAVEKGVTEGTSATTFSPNASCTRAQMVTFLWRSAGSPAPKTAANPFKDISANDYYYDAVLWAVEQGITSGTSADTFAPSATVSRAQTVTFLYRAAGSPAVSGGSFSDVAANAYYANAVAWASQNNITSGTGGGKFSPSSDCTRGQIVTLLYRANSN